MTVEGDYLRLLRTPWSVDPLAGVDEVAPGVTVVIPTYTPVEGERTASLRLCVDSVLRGGTDLPIAFVVVDNGLSASAARLLGEMLRATGRPHHIVTDPERSRGDRYTAARARNTALAYLAAVPPRHRHLLFLDDDTALAPGALDHLLATLGSRPEAIAACPRVIPVADPGAWLARAGTLGTVTDAAKPLPGALRDGGCYDLLSTTSHGSLVTGRTVGLLVRAGPVLSWTRRFGALFYEGTPYGSTEDVLVMATLSRLGEVWSVPAATVADEARRTPGATRSQQFRWGYDHAWLSRAMAEAGLLEPGVHTLDWFPGRGWEYARLDWGAGTGFLVNSAELLLGHRMLSAVTDDRNAGGDMFGPPAERVAAGNRILGRILRRWQASRCSVERAWRPDLPPLVGRDWAGLRDGLDALLGHLAGNVVGSLDNGGDGAPPFFLYGARQPADQLRPDRRREPVTSPIDWSARWSFGSA